MCLFFHIIINELIFSIKLNEEITQNTNLRDLIMQNNNIQNKQKAEKNS
jgi:hypothetical protein